MNIATIEVDQEIAEKKYKEYLEAVKTRKAKEYNELRKAYRALSKGLKVIDIYKAFEDTGVDKNGNPKLAIASADLKQINLVKERDDSCAFTRRRNSWDKNWSGEVVLPTGIFKEWPRVLGKDGLPTWQIKDDRLTTNVPIIPAHLLPTGDLKNYHILFEVNRWSPIATVGDPYLLQRINANTFIVLAEWDVTDVESIVMRGRS